MLKSRRRNWIKELRINRYKDDQSDIAFKCLQDYPGFTKGYVYHPIAYRVTEYGYTDFDVMDNSNSIMHMYKDLVKNGTFGVLYHGSSVKNEYLEAQENMIREMDMERDYQERFFGEET